MTKIFTSVWWIDFLISNISSRFDLLNNDCSVVYNNLVSLKYLRSETMTMHLIRAGNPRWLPQYEHTASQSEQRAEQLSGPRGKRGWALEMFPLRSVIWSWNLAQAEHYTHR